MYAAPNAVQLVERDQAKWKRPVEMVKLWASAALALALVDWGSDGSRQAPIDETFLKRPLLGDYEGYPAMVPRRDCVQNRTN